VTHARRRGSARSSLDAPVFVSHATVVVTGAGFVDRMPPMAARRTIAGSRSRRRHCTGHRRGASGVMHHLAAQSSVTVLVNDAGHEGS
jgi:hypothetical protein